MVCSSFNHNIQYQRTGIDSLHFLGEIELRQSIKGLFSYSSSMAVFDASLPKQYYLFKIPKNIEVLLGGK